ncbi:MAG: ATP-binding protein [Saprospiraceae bacterium]|nr:ATP-binding protein [Candidatus Opimibacter skivensis]
MIGRILSETILSRIQKPGKVIILYGARQVGKTTLIQEMLKQQSARVLEISADQVQYHDILSSRNLDKMKGLVAGYDILFIDEAQRIPDIGINLKILYEGIPELRIIVTGSSSLDLANQIKEPLTGRTWTYKLYPVSAAEWQTHAGLNTYELQQKIPDWLRYGLYPEVLTLDNHEDKRQYLNELTSSYLYKDILEIGNIRYPQKIRQLLSLLAYQLGNLVSIQELANTLQINRETILHYIDLLEKSFVIFTLGPYSRNLRKEITSKNKIYFYDLGIRNALIENFSPIDLRPDLGALWENYLLMERKKKMEYSRSYPNMYFWRTYSGAEVDFVEEKDGLVTGYEFKWQSKSSSAPKAWMDTYGQESWKVIDKENFGEFVL